MDVLLVIVMAVLAMFGIWKGKQSHDSKVERERELERRRGQEDEERDVLVDAGKELDNAIEAEKRKREAHASNITDWLRDTDFGDGGSGSGED